MPRPEGWRRWLMMNRWHAGSGNLFHSSIILFEKNVFRAVVLHLGVKSFCECPLNPYVSKAGWKNLALSTLSFSLSILYTSIGSPRNLRFSNEYISSCFNLSSYVDFLSPLTSLVARLWICSRQSLSFIMHISNLIHPIPTRQYGLPRTLFRIGIGSYGRSKHTKHHWYP